MNLKRILFVEDDDTLAFIISKKIEYLGYKITICKNGKDAIQNLSSPLRFDLVISDNILPYYSGIEILKYIRQDLNSNIPFILISFDSSIYLKETFYKSKGTSFINKPFDFELLLKAIQDSN